MRDRQIRQQVLPDLRTVTAPQPAQVRLTLADANQAEVGNYLHASAYLAARAASGLTAQTLNDLAGHFGMPPQQAPMLMQRIFEATPACPLQGTFAWRPATSGGCWASSAWHEPSIFELKEVPAGYRFPFLDWLRGATVEFSLTDATLAADVTLTVRNEPAGRSVPVSVENDVADDGAQPQADMGTTAGDELSIAPGDPLIVNVDRAAMQIGTRTVMELPRHTSLVAIEVRGDWVGVWGFRDGQAARGWIHRRDVLPQRSDGHPGSGK